MHSLLNYLNYESSSAPGIQYMRHYHLIGLGFLITRIVGYSLIAMWLYKGGPEVEELLLPRMPEENATQK